MKIKGANVALPPTKKKGAKDHLVLVIASAAQKSGIGLKDLVIDTGLTRKQVLRVMDKLTRLGYLIKTQEKLVKKSWDTHGGRRMRLPTWEINTARILDVGKIVKRKPNSVRDKIWRGIRIKRKFTPKELAEFVGASYDVICDYLRILEYHQVIHRKPNMGKFKEFLLLTDPGPIRPVLPEISNKDRLTQRREDAK